MRTKFTLLVLVVLLGGSVTAQSTAESVYHIFTKNNCNNSYCHGSSGQSGGLDLEGSGATNADKIASIRAAIFDASPVSSYAAAEGHRIIYPGDPYRSTLFRRLHRGMDNTVNYNMSEGDEMPQNGNKIPDNEIELIRQWILYGAPTTGQVVDSSMIADYYNGNGYASMPTPPPAPAAGEGFQIHLGPFFLAPNAEEEFFWKYRTDLPNTTEVTAVSPIFGAYSHHFILNRFGGGNTHGGYDWGLRSKSSHFDAPLVGVFQFADTLALPEETAFSWDQGEYLDFNTHYINYDQTKIEACDVYLNVYTQTSGTAKQIMVSEMVPNFAIYIPNDQNIHTFELPFFNPLDQSTRYVWSVTSHTHKYGIDFKVFTRNSGGSKDDQIYDASYKDGDPNGLFIGYDYQHPPQRFFPNFLPVKTNEGIIQVASYLNNGPAAVSWGDESDDEMMLLIYYYLNDTAGVPTANDPNLPDRQLLVYPNPATGTAWLVGEDMDRGLSQFSLTDLQGRIVRSKAIRTWGGYLKEQIDLKGLPQGLYLYRLEGSEGGVYTGKLLVRE